MDKSGQGEYLTMISRHLLLSCNPFWRSGNFSDTIGPSRSLCVNQWEGGIDIQTALLFAPPWIFRPSYGPEQDSGSCSEKTWSNWRVDPGASPDPSGEYHYPLGQLFPSTSHLNIKSYPHEALLLCSQFTLSNLVSYKRNVSKMWF